MPSAVVGLALLGHLAAGETSLVRLSEEAGVGRAILSALLAEMDSKGLLEFDGELIRATSLTKPLFAAYLHNAGVSLEELGTKLTWKEFEGLAADALNACGFVTTKTFRMRKPTREIDVIGVHSGFALAFDCKHWGRVSRSALARASERQVERCRQYLSTLTARSMGVRAVMPALLVLHGPDFGRLDGVAIVGVDKVFSFVMAARGLTEEFTTVRSEE